MSEFEAIVKIRDFYGFREMTDDQIKRILIKNLESDADVEVIEVIEIKRIDTEEK